MLSVSVSVSRTPIKTLIDGKCSLGQIIFGYKSGSIGPSIVGGFLFLQFFEGESSPDLENNHFRLASKKPHICFLIFYTKYFELVCHIAS